MRIIAHVYIHNFFITAMRERHNELTGQAFAVFKKNTVMDTTPKAEKAGIKPGFKKRHALQACPDLTCIDYDNRQFLEKAQEVGRVCYKYSPKVETTAENELFIDFSGTKPPKYPFLLNLAHDIVPNYGSHLTISLAPNRLLAKAATLIWLSMTGKTTLSIPGFSNKNHEKMDLCLIKPSNSNKFAGFLPVDFMWPIDITIIKQFKKLGIHTFGDITRIPPAMIQGNFGAIAPLIINYSQGIDDSIIPIYTPPGNITFYTRCHGIDKTGLEGLLKRSAATINNQLASEGKSYRQLALTVFCDNQRAQTRISNYNRAKHGISSLFFDSLNLLEKINVSCDISEISLTASKLVPNRHNQITIFDDNKNLNGRDFNHKEKLARVCKNLAAKYAPGIVAMGNEIPISRREQILMFIDPLRS